MSQHENASEEFPQVQLSEDELEQVSGGTLTPPPPDPLTQKILGATLAVLAPVIDALVD